MKKRRTYMVVCVCREMRVSLSESLSFEDEEQSKEEGDDLL